MLFARFSTLFFHLPLSICLLPSPFLDSYVNLSQFYAFSLVSTECSMAKELRKEEVDELAENTKEPTGWNGIPKLIALLVEGNDSDAISSAASALESFFVARLREGDLWHIERAEDDDDKALRQWCDPGTLAKLTPAADAFHELRYLPDGSFNPMGIPISYLPEAAARVRKQYRTCTWQLLRLLERPNLAASAQLSGLGALMEFSRREGSGKLSAQLCGDSVESLVGGKGFRKELLHALSQYCRHPDVQYVALKALKRLAERSEQGKLGEAQAPDVAEADPEDVCRNVYDALSSMEFGFSDYEDGSQSAWCETVRGKGMSGRGKKRGRGGEKWRIGSERRRAFSGAWLSFLRMRLPSDVYRRVLLWLPEEVMPHMANPLLLSDFFGASVSRGGMDGMLALNGLFILMTEHGLEYPTFVKELYGLLTENAFHSSHRKRFFDLLATFLKSSLISGHNAAAFAKALGRLSLRAPPSGCLISTCLIHNLARRHPSCSLLLHRRRLPSSAPADSDPYDPTQSDPSLSRGIESSLWEATALRNHYCPEVARFASILERKPTRSGTSDLPVPRITSRSYGSLISEYLAKRVKSAPTSFYSSESRPTGLTSVPSGDLSSFSSNWAA